MFDFHQYWQLTMWLYTYTRSRWLLHPHFCSEWWLIKKYFPFESYMQASVLDFIQNIRVLFIQMALFNSNQTRKKINLIVSSLIYCLLTFTAIVVEWFMYLRIAPEVLSNPGTPINISYYQYIAQKHLLAYNILFTHLCTEVYANSIITF